MALAFSRVLSLHSELEVTKVCGVLGIFLREENNGPLTGIMTLT